MATKKAAKPAKKSPRPQSLPGMEDNKIEALEEIALSYADVRDERIGFSQREVELKGQLLQLMKAQKREHLPPGHDQHRHRSRERKREGEGKGRRGKRTFARRITSVAAGARSR